MTDPREVQKLADQLMSGLSPDQNKALLDALLSGRVSSIFEKLHREEVPTVRPVPSDSRGFRVRLDLHGAKPPVWRRLELPGDLTLPRLHDVIQTAMGWQDSHLHRFRTGRDHRSPHFVTRIDFDEGDEGTLEDDIRLDQLVTEKGDELWYEYDFGDGWDHVLVVERVLADPPAVPTCTAGRMACPPEDCGGAGGYEELANWVRSGYDDALLPYNFADSAQGREWLPLEWHPDDFSVEEINEALRSAGAEPVAVGDELTGLMNEMERYGIRLLRDVLARPDSYGPTDVSDSEAARLTETYRTFLDIVGDGLDLTAAGYLRPVVVEEVADRTGISGWWIGKANREDVTRPVADIRATARALGLVSVRKGRLSPTATARRWGSDPQALLRHIIGRLPLGTQDAERQCGWMALASVGSGTMAQNWYDEVSNLMFGLGWRSGHDLYPAPLAISPTLDVLRLLAGASRAKRGDVVGVDDGLARVARAVGRR